MQVARKEIGVTEEPKGSNRQKYGKWYGFDGVAWCAMFVSYCFDRAGLPLGNIQHPKGFAYCPFGVAHFKARSQWFTKPEVGDIVFFNFGSGIAKHVGIVEAVHPNGTITSIEGNTGSESQDNGGRVMRKIRYPQDIVGYGRPNFDRALGDRELKLQIPYLQGKDVRELQRILFVKGYQLTVDGVFGKETDKQLRQFQRDHFLDFDGVVGRKTLVALKS